MNYNFPNKRHWRRTLYAYVDRWCKKQKGQRRILYLESSQALETIFLVKQKGYKPAQLYPVCDSPAVQAWITTNAERVGIRGLNVRNGPVENIVRECAREEIYFDSFNLDFTGPISQSLLTALLRISTCLKPFSVVSLTILRGRESEKLPEQICLEGKEKWLEEAAKLQADCRSAGVPWGETLMDSARLMILQQSLLNWEAGTNGNPNGGWSFGKPNYGFYMSDSGQTMLYYRGVALRYQNVQLLKQYAKQSEEERRQLLDRIPRDEWPTILNYAKLMDFRPAFYGMLN